MTSQALCLSCPNPAAAARGTCALPAAAGGGCGQAAGPESAGTAEAGPGSSGREGPCTPEDAAQVQCEHERARVYMCARACAHVRACVCVLVRMCACVYVRARMAMCGSHGGDRSWHSEILACGTVPCHSTHSPFVRFGHLPPSGVLKVALALHFSPAALFSLGPCALGSHDVD